MRFKIERYARENEELNAENKRLKERIIELQQRFID
jgi:hypothetical protein